MDKQEKNFTKTYNLIGRDISDAEEILQDLGNVCFVDEKIYTKLEDGGYLMKRSYAVNGSYIDVYYDRINGTITGVQTSNE